MLTACYDLKCNPPTYDVVAFLAHAELERLRQGADGIDLHILPGPREGFRPDNLWPHSVKERIHLRDNVLAPLCWLLPSVKSVAVRQDRRVQGWGFNQRHIGLPKILEALRAGCRPLRIPPIWNHQSMARLQRGKYVAFTLREAEHHKLRNSYADEWVRALVELKRLGFEVIIVRDTVKARYDVDGQRFDVPTAPAASKILSVRAELYSSAALNVGVCNGPMWMSIFMDAPTLMLRPTTNEAGGCYDDAFYAKCGLRRGEQLPTNPPHQRLVWEEDWCDTIVGAVEEMMEVVNG